MVAAHGLGEALLLGAERGHRVAELARRREGRQLEGHAHLTDRRPAAKHEKMIEVEK